MRRVEGEKSRSDVAVDYMILNMNKEKKILIEECFLELGLSKGTLDILYYKAREEAESLKRELEEEEKIKEEIRKKKFYFDDSKLFNF